MTININGVKVTLKRTLRSLVFYESITKKMFAPETITDVITYYYSVVMSSAKDMQLTLDDFMDWLDSDDSHASTIGEFSNWLAKANAVESQLSDGEKKRTVK